MKNLIANIDRWALKHGGNRAGAIGVWILAVLFYGPMIALVIGMLYVLPTIGHGIYIVLAIGVAIGVLLSRGGK